MTSRAPVRWRLVLAVLSFAPAIVRAQGRPKLPLTPADWMVEEGRWSEAEALFYLQSERAPRNPVLRASLGRFLASKGAVIPGIVLIDEARQFGLDTTIANDLLTPLNAIEQWRMTALELKRDSTIVVRDPGDPTALLQLRLPRTNRPGRPLIPAPGLPDDQFTWHDLSDRGIGIDSAASGAIGIEVFEAFVPSLDVRTRQLTLHANAHSALSASGARYPVLRTQEGIRVLVGERRMQRLADALRDLHPTWWQLDLPHGLLVVRQ